MVGVLFPKVVIWMGMEGQPGRVFTCVQGCLRNPTTYTDDDCKATHSP